MGLTPADITGAAFSQSRKGYDIAQVDAHLRSLAERVAAEPAEEFEQIGDEVASVLRAANDTAASLRAKATAEAEATVAEAERCRAEAEAFRSTTLAEANRALAEAEAYAAETRRAADDYSTTTRRDADEYATQTRAAAGAHAEQSRDTALEEARIIRTHAEDDARRRAAAMIEDAQEKVAELEGIENDIRGRVQAIVFEVQRLSALTDGGTGVIDLRERRRAEADDVPAARALWTAVGDAMAKPDGDPS